MMDNPCAKFVGPEDLVKHAKKAVHLQLKASGKVANHLTDNLHDYIFYNTSFSRL